MKEIHFIILLALGIIALIWYDSYQMSKLMNANTSTTFVPSIHPYSLFNKLNLPSTHLVVSHVQFPTTKQY